MICLAYGTMKAALFIHHILLHTILGAPMDFFDTTPKGRIIARFSNDINTIDNNLPMSLRQILNTIFRVGENRYEKKHLTTILKEMKRKLKRKVIGNGKYCSDITIR